MTGLIVWSRLHTSIGKSGVVSGRKSARRAEDVVRGRKRRTGIVDRLSVAQTKELEIKCGIRYRN